MEHDPHERIALAIAHAAHLLPAQGPIGVFVHHNTLHAFEHLPFEEAVEEAASLLFVQPWLSEARYHDELGRGRIAVRDVDAVLAAEFPPEEAAHPIAGGRLTRGVLRRLLLVHGVPPARGATLRWTLAETPCLARVRDGVTPAARARLIAATRSWLAPSMIRGEVHEALRQGAPGSHEVEPWPLPADVPGIAALLDRDPERLAVATLWLACRAATAASPDTPDERLRRVRHRGMLFDAIGVDTDDLVHPIVVRLCAAFLDQGLAYWPLPDRAQGLYHTFLRLYGQPLGSPEPWLSGLAAELRAEAAAGLTPLASIARSLADLGIAPEEEGDYIRRALLTLRGWAGMVHQMVERPDRAPVSAPPASLADLLAVRLILDRRAVRHVARTSAGYDGPLAGLRAALAGRTPTGPPAGALERAWLLFQVAQVAGLAAPDLEAAGPSGVAEILSEIAAFPPLVRRRLLHRAYERRHRVEVLDAVATHARVAPSAPSGPAHRPALQLVLCIDERCESLRRHLEEQGPQIETFGTPGFFSVPMYYRGAEDAHAVPLCPVNIRPQHRVEEVVAGEPPAVHDRRERVRHRLGRLSVEMDVATRTLARGGLLTAGLGFVAAVPLVARVLFPRLTARLQRASADARRGTAATRLALERTSDEPHPVHGLRGFSVAEMTAIVARQLEDIGMIGPRACPIAPLVAIVGHGSSSLNNPHESAHDCGACGGGRGGPNARAFAQMANDPRVRAALAEDGVVLPADTVFVGAYHNTCDDSVTLYDTDLAPASHQEHFVALRLALDEARTLDAHERCRRFEAVSLAATPAEALAHVEARSEDLAQPRPEYGHATNAVCVVGRRERTRGLFLDRRAFLVSYDPTGDADGAILERILPPVAAVGAGINLEYWFSYVDPTGYGCGTKLPHNITGFVGVMDGHASDLRTGLPWQMVEIHEPVRLLVVVETTAAALLAVAAKNETVGRLVTNGWVQLATLSPRSGAIEVFEGDRFVPYEPESAALPAVRASVDWYAGRRDPLPAARIESGLQRVGEG